MRRVRAGPALGGSLARLLEALPRLQALELQFVGSQPVNNAVMIQLEGLTELTRLSVPGALRVTNGGLPTLLALTGLRCLDLSCWAVRGACCWGRSWLWGVGPIITSTHPSSPHLTCAGTAE